MTTVKSLPTPDEFGNYWLDRSYPEICHMPAIFPSKRKVFTDDTDVAEVKHDGTFILTLGIEGFLFERGGMLKRFKSPELALREYNRLAG